MKNTPRSIASTLSVSLGLVGLGGAVILLLFIIVAYHFTIANLSSPDAIRNALQEISAHVLVPMLFLAAPMYFAAQWAIRRALKPLDEIITVAETAKTQPATVKLLPSRFPREVAPFVSGVNNLLGRVQQANEANANFAADVAHELRTPLTLLSLELDRIDHKDVPALKGEVIKMQKLVHQLMLIAQIDSDAVAEEQQEVIDLTHLADDVVAQMAPQAIAEGRALALEFDAPLPATGRQAAVAAALRNLVENAIRVTPAGGTVTITAGPDASLHVSDGGPGLGQMELDRLTNRLVRADSASKHGAGLGLSIVSKIVKAHGGTLRSTPSIRTISIILPH